jgi:AraC family transcriptional regulator
VDKMLKLYELLENILLDIENNIKSNINASILSKKHNLSEGHLRRLFSFTFKQSIASYMRSRRLAASLDDILKTTTNILDIAIEYDFDYEETYIRAFQREFGITPGNLRKTGQIIKIKPPLHLFDKNKLGDSVIFGPDIVMVPQFYIIGRRHRIPLENHYAMLPQLGKQFWENERDQIKKMLNPNVYIGLLRIINGKEKHLEYTTSVQVENVKKVPHGLCCVTLKTAMYAKFRYIGQHHYYDIDKNAAIMISNNFNKFFQNEYIKYKLLTEVIEFFSIDTELYDGTTCHIEWYTPVSEEH